MSLILEALRKSEAERRRGQVPDLHAELPPTAPPVRSARPAWPWLALALALAVGAVVAMAWLARGVWPAPAPAVGTPSDVVDSSPPADTAAESYAGHTGAGSGGADTAMATVTPADPHDLTTAISPPRPATMTSAAAVESASVPPPRADPAAAPVRDAVAAPATVATAMPPAAAAALPRPPPAPMIAPTPASMSALPPATADAAPLRLSDLTATERLELPPLKMSMHMWGPTPAQRFAIIDGARVSEGDRIGDAVIDEITASAVVLAWHGQRLQIPLR